MATVAIGARYLPKACVVPSLVRYSVSLWTVHDQGLAQYSMIL